MVHSSHVSFKHVSILSVYLDNISLNQGPLSSATETSRLSFTARHHFLPNPDRILPTLTFHTYNPLDVNAGRILLGFGGK